MQKEEEARVEAERSQAEAAKAAALAKQEKEEAQAALVTKFEERLDFSWEQYKDLDTQVNRTPPAHLLSVPVMCSQ